LKETPMWDDAEKMLLPGELEYRSKQEKQKTGIPVPAKTYEELLEFKKRFEIEAELPRKK